MIDAITSAAKYRAHLSPVWAALPQRLRGSHFTDEREAREVHRAKAVLVASHADLRAARRLRYERIALMEHGVGQSYSDDNPSLPGGGNPRNIVGLFLSPNATAAQRDRERYPRARVEVVGSPRLETLPKREKDGETVVAVSFHPQYSAEPPEMRSAYEHFRPALPALVEAYKVIGHTHPNWTALADEYAKLGIEYVADFDEVCRRADVYVCDNSSTIFEFAAKGGNVVLLDSPDYRWDVEHGLRFWAAAGVGVHAMKPDGLVAAVAEALKYPAAKRDAALKVVYGFKTGAAKRAAKVIADWL